MFASRQKLLAMNFGGLLLLMLQICYCTERCTSAKPDNITNQQYKGGKPDSVSSSATRHKPKKSLRTFLYKKQKWPQPSGENLLKRVRKITKLPTTSTHCKIFCRSGYHLQILPNGVVKGTLDQDSKYGKSYNVVHDRGQTNLLNYMVLCNTKAKSETHAVSFRKCLVPKYFNFGQKQVL